MNQSTENPLISVVIPAYNEEKFIGPCLLSLQKQKTNFPFEVIVVDNNSVDNTARIARSLGVRVLQETKPGVCAARQTGTKQAYGSIVVSTDADTVFGTDWLQNIKDEFEKNPNLVAVTGPVNFVKAPLWGKWAFAGLFWTVKKIYRQSGKIKYISAANTAFRKAAFRGYNTDLTQGGDEIFLLRQLQTQGPIKFIDNMVHTSSRRLHKGLAYNFLVTFLAYYVFDYLVGTRRRKSLLGSYKPIREHQPKQDGVWVAVQLFAVLVLSIALYTAPVSHVFAKKITKSHLAQRTTNRIDLVEDKIHGDFDSR